ncbi:MAG: phosphoribosylformylglycinamidine cyclo-ligase, partial [Actinobacteria bacterium]|nr:phosphoribosylformylglycinamidine cyclo-ligase [Actinomycetota bacterium]
VFDVIAQRVDRAEMERTFNMGVGMVAFVAPDAVDAALALLDERNVDSWVCGTVRDRRDGEMGDAEAKGGKGGAATVIGNYAR